MDDTKINDDDDDNDDEDSVEIVQVLHFTDDCARPTKMPIGRWEQFERALPQEVREVLINRCLHGIMRQDSSKFTLVDPRSIFMYLLDEYSPNDSIYLRLWDDYYDASVLASKLELKMNPSGSGIRASIALLRKSDALEALKKPQEAIRDLMKSVTSIDLILTSKLLTGRLDLSSQWDWY